LFNVSNYHALSTSLSTAEHDRLIWAPNIYGCVRFLIASGLSWMEVCGGVACRPRRQAEWWVAALNLAGSVAFAIAGVASYFVPDTGDILDLAAANFTTVIGALCFLAGAVGRLVEGTHTRIPTPLVPAAADAAISPTGMTRARLT
jgi:hypothetical protein